MEDKSMSPESFIEKLKSGNDLRENLIELKLNIRKMPRRETYALSEAFEKEKTLVIKLLSDKDPKIRKNIALILGELSCQEYLEDLYKAYKEEKQLFARASYLEAISQMDYDSIRKSLEGDLCRLEKEKFSEEERKHRLNEYSEIKKMLGDDEKKDINTGYNDGKVKHFFADSKQRLTFLMTVNRNYTDILEKDVTEISPDRGILVKKSGNGLIICTDRIKELQQIRYYDEILLMPFTSKYRYADDGAGANAGANAEKLAKKMLDEGLVKYLRRILYVEDSAQNMKNAEIKNSFRFRTELRTGNAAAEIFNERKRLSFVKTFSEEIERCSGGELINSTSDYELEIRFVIDGRMNVYPFIKLSAIDDRRFGYRLSAGAYAIKPQTAALCLRLSEKFLKKDAQVLDPFCGCGTFLIERSICMKCSDEYGIDIKGEEIDRARKNAEKAHFTINYINRDFFEFTHNYLFDEIITDMPFKIAGKGKIRDSQKNADDPIYIIYKNFFKNAIKYLKSDGIMLLYTHDYELIHLFSDSLYTIKQEFEISKVNGTYLIVLAIKG